MKKNKHIGSTFESFLEEAGILEEVNAAAVKAVLMLNRAAAILGRKIEIHLVPTSSKK